MFAIWTWVMAFTLLLRFASQITPANVQRYFPAYFRRTSLPSLPQFMCFSLPRPLTFITRSTKFLVQFTRRPSSICRWFNLPDADGRICAGASHCRVIWKKKFVFATRVLETTFRRTG